MVHVESPESICRFGIAVGDITPPRGIYHRMWGAATHDRATGVHRPLRATAMVVQSPDAVPPPGGLQVFIAVDHCLLWGSEMDRLLEVVAAATDLPAVALTVLFSHTHAAGLMDPGRASLPGGEGIAGYLEGMARRIGELVVAARRESREVTLTYGVGRCDLAANRDGRDPASGQFVCGFNPEGETEDTVLVARVTGDDGEPLATIVNYACHPTTLAWENTLISPDYPGAMRELVEQVTGAPCVFIQGASAELGPREGFVGDTAVADRNGRQLGHAALAALEALPPPRTSFRYAGPVISGATVGTWEHVPVTAARRARLAEWRLLRFTVDLDYRPGLPDLESVERDHARWQEREIAARERGDAEATRDARAMVERFTRQRTRLRYLPPGRFPMPVVLWRAGDAIWLAVEGEHYSVLGRALRRRFARVPILVATLSNGSRPSYLLPVEAYVQGLYQESVAVLAPGSLERLIEAVGEKIQEVLGER